MIDIETPGSPGWWVNVLARQLHERRVGRRGRTLWTRSKVASSRVRPGLLLLDDYLRGDPPLHDDIHGGWADPFRRFLRMGRINAADLVVGATTSRMGIRDFRTAAGDDELGDAQARLLMQKNGLKLKARDVHDWMVGLGDAYTIVTPPDKTRDWSLITAESPLQCITAHDPATGATLAGLKIFRDEWQGADFAYLFLPGELWVARHDAKATTIRQSGPFAWSSAWEWDEDMFDDVPGERVAMIRFRNRKGISDFEEHIDHLDRINDKVFNEWWITKIQAFRQRAIKLDDEDDVDDDADLAPAPDDGPTSMLYSDNVSTADLASMFTSSPDALWRLPKDAEIWESQEVNIEQLMKSIDGELKKLAAMVRISLPSMTPDVIANGSAEGAQLMREEHTFHIEDRCDRAEVAWAETVGMAFLFQGDTERADPSQIEPIWAPVERYSLTEKAQASSQAKGVVPIEAILTDIWQYSPADVQDRLRKLRGQDQLFDAQVAAPAPTPPPAPRT